jgi:hypothetical protein
MVVRALRFYQKTLNNLASDEEGETIFQESDPFGHYLVNTAKEAGTAAKVLKESPNSVNSLVKEDRYRAIVQEALMFYVADLRRRQDIIIGEELEHSKRISSPYENELSTTEIMSSLLAKK